MWNEFTFVCLLNEMYLFEWTEGILKFLESDFTQVLYKCMSPKTIDHFLHNFMLPKLNQHEDDEITEAIAGAFCQSPYAVELSYVLMLAGCKKSKALGKV